MSLSVRIGTFQSQSVTSASVQYTSRSLGAHFLAANLKFHCKNFLQINQCMSMFTCAEDCTAPLPWPARFQAYREIRRLQLDNKIFLHRRVECTNPDLVIVIQVSILCLQKLTQTQIFSDICGSIWLKFWWRFGLWCGQKSDKFLAS